MSRTIDEIKADMQKPCGYTDICKLEFELRNALIFDIPLGRLEAICTAERDGRCVVLPCKVGDTVYEVAKDDCDEEDCPDEYHEYVEDVYIEQITYQTRDDGTTEIILNDYLDIEDTYPTRTEAKAVLKGAGE